MAEEALGSFCGSQFWNNNLTWYADSPSFTPCFEKTFLVWIPSAFLWLFSSVDIYFIFTSQTRNIPWNWRNIIKLILLTLLFLICIFDFAYNCYRSDSVYPVDLYTPLLKMCCLAFCCMLIIFQRRYGQRSSGLLFTYWFLVVILGYSQFNSYLKEYASSHEIRVPIVNYSLFYCLCVIMFLLHWTADLPPKDSAYASVVNPCPEESSSFPSKLTFSWLDKTMYLGFRRPLVSGDLWSMNPQDTASEVFHLFDKYWSPMFSKKKNSYVGISAKYQCSKNSVDFNKAGKETPNTCSILPALFKAFGPGFLFGTSFKLAQDILAFASPELLRYLIDFTKGDEPQWRGYFYASLLLSINIFQLLLSTQYSYISMKIGLRIKTALRSAIFRKALRLSNSARKESTLGEIVNLMAVDAQKFYNIIISLNSMWSIPLQIILAIIFLWQTLGPSILMGLAVLIIMIPVNTWIANILKGLQIKQMKYKDERVKVMNEILSGMKVLKLYSWETCFEERVLAIRKKEIKVLKQSAYLKAVTSFLWSCTPFLVSLLTFSIYILIDENNILDTSKAFVSLSLFNILKGPMAMLPFMITDIIQVSVSIKRINKFLNSEELDPEVVNCDNKEVDPLVMENGTFSWGPDEEPILCNLNLRIKAGLLVAVVGAVGSGKSSLLSAFLGELINHGGKVNIKGSIAYVPQLAWIQNSSLQDNILFGKPLDHKKYSKVVDVCALKPDLEIFPGGDQTEIGERGINLSGGQKQRVSLARAVYSDCDIYFLDDPLSAVDSHVSKHIFENVISTRGVLQHKTRLLVTHSVTYLPEVDMIVVLKDGIISEVGSYSELLNKKGAFSQYLTTYLHQTNDGDFTGADSNENEKNTSYYNSELERRLSRQNSVISSSSTDCHEKMKPNSGQNINEEEKGKKMIKEETVEVGRVKQEVYFKYFRDIGCFMFSATVILTAVSQCLHIGSNVWLSYWSSDAELVLNNTQDPNKRDMYLGVYALFGAADTIASFLSSIFWYIGAARAATFIHFMLLLNILRSPMSFFDTTPQGRIISRFAKDIDVIDNVIPLSFKMLLSFLSSVIGTMLVISYSMPVFIAVIIPIALVYYGIQRVYVATSQQIKRLESVSTSPVYSHFGESILGASVIRAFKAQKRFIKESEDKVDFNQVCTFPSIVASRWLAIRLQMIGNLIIFFVALFAVLGKDTLSPGIVGLSITYALQITQSLTFIVSSSSDLETNIISAERVKEYSETPQEAAWDITPRPVEDDWPQEGKLEFVDYKVRYREGLDLVLKGINIVINGGEKVGIVGRTGAGKSSVTMGLFRIMESAGGKILIDGTDISKLGLHTLRTRLTIIPQDPVLFSGSLRMNLDPFGYYSDEKVWKALELSHLKSFVNGLPAGLQHEVTEGGDNISVGQRQMICLARALLRKTKILILDEATAAVDFETDDFIQKTIQTEFSSCTVLTIAHRLNTVIDSDRVLVLDQGHILEFDDPAILLKNKSSAFYSMAHDAGLV